MQQTKPEIIFVPEQGKTDKQPLFTEQVSAGFPSPAADYEEGRLDLNRHLVRNPAATFFVKVSGDSMIGAGIHSGDMLIVDRSLQAKSSNIIIAVIDGELTVKRIKIKNKRIFLIPENENYSQQEITEENDFQVWGVVTSVIHPL